MSEGKDAEHKRFQSAGIDGCAAGWLFVGHTSAGWRWRVSARLDELLELCAPDAVVFIDMPVVLDPQAYWRSCDLWLRRTLGGRASSRVFAAPLRGSLTCESYECFRDYHRDRTGKGASVQTWNLLPKVREVQRWVQSAKQPAPFESHPELHFCEALGQAAASKHTAAGIAQREAIVETRGLGTRYAEMLASTRRRDVKRDDLLDALILAIEAEEARKVGVELLGWPVSETSDQVDAGYARARRAGLKS